MTGNEYQKKALEVKLYHEQKITPQMSKLLYLQEGLTGENGELAEKLKKIVRDSACTFTPETLELVKKECADILWYLVAIIEELGFDFDSIMECSLTKIQDRIARGVLKGSGDLR